MSLTYVVPPGTIQLSPGEALWPKTLEWWGQVSMSYGMTQLNAHTYGTIFYTLATVTLAHVQPNTNKVIHITCPVSLSAGSEWCAQNVLCRYNKLQISLPKCKCHYSCAMLCWLIKVHRCVIFPRLKQHCHLYSLRNIIKLYDSLQHWANCSL